jgi:hypothetical protein
MAEYFGSSKSKSFVGLGGERILNHYAASNASGPQLLYGKLESALKDKDVVIESLQSENNGLRKQLMLLQNQFRSQTQRCRQLEDTVVTFQGLLLRQNPKLHPLFNGSGSDEQRAMFDTFTRHAGSGLVHPTDGQIQRLLLREPSSRSSRAPPPSSSSRPSSAHRTLPPPSSSHIDSSEEEEFEAFLSSGSSRMRPTSAMSQGRPGSAERTRPASAMTRPSSAISRGSSSSKGDAALNGENGAFAQVRDA